MNPVLFVLHHSPPKAFYVDVGANHPVRGSMTHRLDRLGWTGVCAEPNPELAALYDGRRNCSLETRVIGDGNAARFVQEANNEVSGLATLGSEHAGAAATQGRVVETVRLEHALRERGAPTRVAFLAIDVEGADAVVVSDSLLDAYVFEFVLIERPHSQTDERMFKHGYLFSQHFFYDSLFVHSSHPQSGDVSNNKTYTRLPSRCRSPATGKWLGRKRLPGPCKSVFGCCEPM
jgi:FkbM family methyltransferase